MPGIKPYLLTLCFCLSLICIFAPVQAQNMTISTLDQLGAEDILIYSFNGTQQELTGQWNTTSVNVPLPTNDFNIVIRPSAAGRAMDPGLFLSDGFDFLVANVVPLIIAFFLIGLLWARK